MVYPCVLGKCKLAVIHEVANDIEFFFVL